MWNKSNFFPREQFAKIAFNIPQDFNNVKANYIICLNVWAGLKQRVMNIMIGFTRFTNFLT